MGFKFGPDRAGEMELNSLLARMNGTLNMRELENQYVSYEDWAGLLFELLAERPGHQTKARRCLALFENRSPQARTLRYHL